MRNHLRPDQNLIGTSLASTEEQAHELELSRLHHRQEPRTDECFRVIRPMQSTHAWDEATRETRLRCTSASESMISMNSTMQAVIRAQKIHPK